MSFSQVINLLILFGLIHCSYEFNLRNESLRRHRRSNQMNAEVSDFANKADYWQGKAGKAVNEECQKDRKEMEQVCKRVGETLDEISDVGETDMSCGGKWTTVKGELESGIGIIIRSYRRYIEIHKKLCSSMEEFVNEILTQYINELSVIGRMEAPGDHLDRGSSEWSTFRGYLKNYLKYARYHAATLPTALDCTSDFTALTLYHQQSVVTTPAQTVVRITQTAPQYPEETYQLPCNDISQYNGCQACSNQIAYYSQNLANEACGVC